MASEKIKQAVSKIPIKALDVFIVLGIAAMAILIPVLSSMGGFTIQFETDGGSAITSQRLRYGDYVEEPGKPTREGYVFMGWYEDSIGKTPYDFEKNTVQGNQTLYARWKEK